MAAYHLSKQGLCCFDRLERQGDNGLEHMIFVIGANGSIVAIRRCLDTFQSPSMKGFVLFRSQQLSVFLYGRVTLSIFYFDNEHGVNPPDRQIKKA